MLETVNTFLPEANIFIYEELEEQVPDFPCCKIQDVPEFANVFEANKQYISTTYGGSAAKTVGDKFWNLRWFGWFRKVVMNYHAVCVSTFDDEFLVFVDSDIRFTKSFDDEFLRRVTNGKPISFFRGNRPAIDSGLVVVNNKSKKPMKFYKWFMEMFTNGSFRKLDRWDDGYVLTKLVEKCPQEWFCDFASGVKEQKYKNSNGHETVKQVIPFTEWRDYIEHDKGIHIRNKIL